MLQLAMRKSSRHEVFINTSPPENRIHPLRPIKDIIEMDDDSEESYATCFLKRYTKRRASLEHVSLADWAAWYDSCGIKPYIKKSYELDIDNLPLETNINDNDDEEEEEQEELCKKQKK